MADTPSRCPRCGAPLDGVSGTLCPACLPKAALGAEPGTDVGAAGETRLASDPAADTAATQLTPIGSPGHAGTGPRGMPAAIGPYRIVRVLGEGGMGVVSLAEPLGVLL